MSSEHSSETHPGPGNAPEQYWDRLHGRGFLQLQTAVPAVSNNTDGSDRIDPMRAKALLTPMHVTHKKDLQFHVQEPESTVAVDLKENSCSCHSQARVCEHIHHIYELDDRGKLPDTVSLDASAGRSIESEQAVENETNDFSRSISCPHCGRGIGKTTYLRSEIGKVTCNACALDDPEIYYLEVDPSQEQELVYLDELICSGSVQTHYKDSGAMPVYDFFRDHPDVSPDDPVVRVNRQLDEEMSSGLLFEPTVTAVPGTVLHRAMDELTETTDTTTKTVADETSSQSGDPSDDDIPVISSP